MASVSSQVRVMRTVSFQISHVVFTEVLIRTSGPTIISAEDLLAIQNEDMRS
jgi:hypothetical protein